MESNKQLIVISAINIFEGGTLTVLKECLNELNNNFSHRYDIIAYVHKIELFKEDNLSRITLIELPNSRRRWIYRLYYEYIFFRKESKRLNPFIWLSLHDTSPYLINTTKQYVYCHNPAIFYNPKLSSIYYDSTHFMFTLFYRFLYQINIKRNKYLIVQQNWIREEFSKKYKIPISRILVAHPNYSASNTHSKKEQNNRINTIKFFYPSFPRTFKNFEVLIKASKILINKGYQNFAIKLTITGNENRYSKKIKNLSKNIDTIQFAGRMTLEEVHEEYSKSDILLFPSLLETWGLPLSEWKSYEKPILSADLPYAHEAVGNYDQVCFFNPKEALNLAQKMELILNNRGDELWKSTTVQAPPEPFSNSWHDMLNFIIEN